MTNTNDPVIIFTSGSFGRYKIKTQVSVAANIPEKQDLNKLNILLPKYNNVQNGLNSKEKLFVDKGKMVAAKPDFQEVKFTDHAEKRVLRNMGSLVEESTGHFLVFYTFNSPCGTKCANPGHRFNILRDLKNMLPSWKKRAFVFTKVFQPRDPEFKIKRADTIKALKELGKAIGYNIVLRCPENKNCIKCFSGQHFVNACADE